MPIYSTAPLIIVLCHSSHFLNAYVEISTRLFQRYHVPFLKRYVNRSCLQSLKGIQMKLLDYF